METGAGQLQANDRLCQGVEETTITHYDAKGKASRTVHKKRLIMPSKVDCADGIRKMLCWDKKPESDVSDDITELMIMIRRNSGGDTALPDKTDSTQPPRYCLVSILSHCPRCQVPQSQRHDQELSLWLITTGMAEWVVGQ
jgi:hypothetical protein